MKNLKLSKLQVTHFRNLDSTILEFSQSINCIVGPNGHGKTNLLEAIHYLTNRKSFRKNTGFPQILSMDTDRPELTFQSLFTEHQGIGEDKVISYSGKVTGGPQEAKLWYQDGRITKKRIPTLSVFINPFDSYSFHNSPSFRRDWFNEHCSVLYGDYSKNYSHYQKLLKFRNALLSMKPAYFREQIQAIDLQLAHHAYLINQRRMEFLGELSPLGEIIFKEIFAEEHTLQVQLHSSWATLSEKGIYDQLQIQLKKDEAAGRTTYGIHRDDFEALFDGLCAFDYCSLGQQKMAYLGLLFAYIELFGYKFKSYPIVLIDDVSGELDSLRWKRLVAYLKFKKFQVFITTANESFKSELETLKDAHKLLVSAGKITYYN